jgi:hypothetical protein
MGASVRQRSVETNVGVIGGRRIPAPRTGAQIAVTGVGFEDFD